MKKSLYIIGFMILLLGMISLVNGKNCVEDWRCGDWSDCNGFSHSRVCVDANQCNTALYKPLDVEKCYLNSTCEDRILNGDETDIDCGGACNSCSDGKACFRDSDCSNQLCSNGICGKIENPAPVPSKLPIFWLFAIAFLAGFIISNMVFRMQYSIKQTHFDKRVENFRRIEEKKIVHGLVMGEREIIKEGNYMEKRMNSVLKALGKRIEGKRNIEKEIKSKPSEEDAAIRLNMQESVLNKAKDIKGRAEVAFGKMLKKEEFERNLMNYVHRQDPSRLGVNVLVRDRKPEIKQGILESIEKRKEFSERQKFEKYDGIPFFQRKIVRDIMRPFVLVYEKSKPEDFAHLNVHQVRHEVKIPRESKIMGMVKRIEQSLEKPVPEKRVIVLLKETEKGEMMRQPELIDAPEKKFKESKVQKEEDAEKIVEEVEKVDEKEQRVLQKGLLNKKPTARQSKHHLVRKYILSELKETYKERGF